MSRTELHCYQYVNRPYDRVRDALVRDAVGILQRATHSAAGRAQAIVSSLKVSIAGIEIGKDVVVRVTSVQPAEPPMRTGAEATRIELDWQAETNAAVFPSMRAALYVYPLSQTETQLDLRGVYEPPAGVLGAAVDKLVGHRIAEAAVHRLIDDVAAHLSNELV